MFLTQFSCIGLQSLKSCRAADLWLKPHLHLYDENVLISTYAYSGAEKILLGTDFPHQISDLEKAVERTGRLNIGEEEKQKILGENATRLLRLKPHSNGFNWCPLQKLMPDESDRATNRKLD